MIKVEKSNTLVETINKMLNKGAKIQLEYNHQRGTIKNIRLFTRKNYRS